MVFVAGYSSKNSQKRIAWGHMKHAAQKTDPMVYIFGRHAVIEAINTRPEIVEVLHLREDLMQDKVAKALLKKVPKVEYFTDRKLPGGLRSDAVHQGYIAAIDTRKLLVPFKTFRDTVVSDPQTALVLLGEVQDPHNVGAIIRSAAAFGAAAVLVPEHRGCPVTGTVIKTSVGTAFTVPLISVGNVNNALRDLKDRGFWVYGLDGEGDVSLPKEQFSKPSVFVVGNEATGMRQKTHELCDTVLSIPMSAQAESLNASVSAAVTLYAWRSQK